MQVENVECISPNKIKFDFLGKDSIRYENVVEVEHVVYENVKLFCKQDRKGKGTYGFNAVVGIISPYVACLVLAAKPTNQGHADVSMDQSVYPTRQIADVS